MICKNVSPESLVVDARELSARLGAPADSLVDGLCELKEKLYSVAKPSYVAMRVKLKRENGTVAIGNAVSHSRALARLLDGSDECILLVATLGIGVDRLVMRTANASPRDAFVIDALADALIEALCDFAEAEACSGLDTSGRFSPGYADLELSLGRDIIAMTDAERTLGIKLTESGLMVPKKSVNAIIAVRNLKNDQ